jgi:hypothetical protein
LSLALVMEKNQTNRTPHLLYFINQPVMAYLFDPVRRKYLMTIFTIQNIPT